MASISFCRFADIFIFRPYYNIRISVQNINSIHRETIVQCVVKNKPLHIIRKLNLLYSGMYLVLKNERLGIILLYSMYAKSLEEITIFKFNENIYSTL